MRYHLQRVYVIWLLLLLLHTYIRDIPTTEWFHLVKYYDVFVQMVRQIKIKYKEKSDCVKSEKRIE